jgi:hypothetical protein
VTALAAATDSAARAALLEQQASPAEAILGMLRVARERSGDVRRHRLGNGLTPAQLDRLLDRLLARRRYGPASATPRPR